MVQIVQALPTKQTMRQAALQQSLGDAFTAIGKLGDQRNQEEETERQRALKVDQQVRDLREKGFEVNHDQVAAATGLQKDDRGPWAKLFGSKLPGADNTVDLYGKRTKEWQAKQDTEAADKKFKRQGEELDMQFKRSKIAKNYRDIKADDPNTKMQREVIAKQASDIGTKNANLFSVKGGMDSALAQLENPKLSEEEKIKVGQGLLKLLNSAEGSDAVGAEEAQRIGSYLEYKIGNFTQPGSFIGRDLDLFTDQVRNNSKLLSDRIGRNQQGIEGLTQGQSLADLASAAQGDSQLSQMNFRGQDPSVAFKPTNIPNLSPIQNAQAANPLDPQRTQARQSRIQELRAKALGGR